MNLVILAIILIGVGLGGVAVAKRTGAGLGPGSNKYDSLFIKHSRYPKVAKAVCYVESFFDPNAVGDGGRAHGLMQIWMPTANSVGFLGSSKQLMHPETNIKFGCAYLDFMIGKYGKTRGIMGYNLGETRINQGKANYDYYNRVVSKMG